MIYIAIIAFFLTIILALLITLLFAKDTFKASISSLITCLTIFIASLSLPQIEGNIQINGSVQDTFGLEANIIKLSSALGDVLIYSILIILGLLITIYGVLHYLDKNHLNTSNRAGA